MLLNSLSTRSARRSGIAITAGSFALALAMAPTAQAATGGNGGGQASAVVLRAGLDVSLLGGGVTVPLKLSLNDVHAPADAEKTLLTAKLNGVDDGQPFNVLTAKVATARATSDSAKAEGYANLVDAQVHLPGLPSPLVAVKQATSKATCEAGAHPKAESNVLGDVVVLGKKVTLRAGGSTTVNVTDLGQVHLALSQTGVTSDTAAATALQLHISVNPKTLGVADINGDITLANATCQSPQGSGSNGGGSNGGAGNGGSTSGASGSGGSTSGASGSGGATSGASGSGGATSGASGSGGATSGSHSGTTTGTTAGANAGTTAGNKNLAETGASSSTPYIAGGAAVLLAAGGAVVYTTRRRKAVQQ